jgi:hypothetical protein
MSDRPEPRPPTITEEVYLATIKMHVARIEALEAALRGIAELADSDDGISPREAIEIASVALAEEQDK